MKDTFKGVFIGIYENETAKHFGGLFTKIRVATALPSPPSINDEYLILMKGNVAVTFFLQ